MKQNPDKVNGHGAPRYLCKVELDSWLQRFAWWMFRRYLLNEDYYRVVRRFTGPRPRYAHSTRKENATAYRYYVEKRHQTRADIIGVAWRDVA